MVLRIFAYHGWALNIDGDTLSYLSPTGNIFADGTLLIPQQADKKNLQRVYDTVSYFFMSGTCI